MVELQDGDRRCQRFQGLPPAWQGSYSPPDAQDLVTLVEELSGRAGTRRDRSRRLPAFASHVFPFAAPVALILYYLAWKYLVGALNAELGLA